MLSNQIHTEPGSASAAVPHSLRLGRVEIPGRKPPRAPILGGGGKHWPQAPQATEWVARDQSPLRGTTAGDQPVPRTEQSLGAKPGPQSPESRALGWEQGCTAKAQRGDQTPTSASTRGCRSVFSPTQPMYTLIHTLICAHTRVRMHRVCSPGRHLSRNLSALASLLHPSRCHWGKASALERGGQRAEGRGQRSSTSQHLETLWLRNEILLSCPGRCPRRWVRAQEAELKIRALHTSGRHCPFTKSASKMLELPTRSAPETALSRPSPPEVQRPRQAGRRGC